VSKKKYKLILAAAALQQPNKRRMGRKKIQITRIADERNRQVEGRGGVREGKK